MKYEWKSTNKRVNIGYNMVYRLFLTTEIGEIYIYILNKFYWDDITENI